MKNETKEKEEIQTKEQEEKKRPFFGPLALKKPSELAKTLASACVLRCQDGTLAAWAVCPSSGPAIIGRDKNKFWSYMRKLEEDICIVADLDRFAALSFIKPYGFPKEMIPSLLGSSGKILAWRWKRGGKGKHRSFQKIIGLSDHLRRSMSSVDSLEGWDDEAGKTPRAFIMPTYEDRDKEIHLQDAEERAIRLLAIGKELQKTYNRLGVGLKQTRGSAVMGLYRSKYLGKHKANRWRLPKKEDLDFIRQSYFGGRSEVFISGPVGHCYNCDRNSAYAYEMTQAELPIPNDGWELRLSEDPYRVRKAWRNWPGVVRARVVVDDFNNPFPVLPHRTDDNKVIYPHGTFEGTWTTIELAYAEATGTTTVVEILDALLYTKKVRYLADIATNLWKLRKRKGLGGKLAKGLLTSLAGKWGQRPGRLTKLLPISEFRAKKHTKGKARQAWMKWPNSANPIFAQLVSIDKETEQGHACVIWSSIINSMGRIALHKAMLENGPDNVVSCDTDGIWTKEIYQTGNGKRLGQFRIDIEVQDFAAVGRQVYTYVDMQGESHTIASGLSHIEAQKVFECGVTSRMANQGFAQALALGSQEKIGTINPIELSMPELSPGRYFTGSKSRPYFVGSAKKAVKALEDASKREIEKQQKEHTSMMNWLNSRTEAEE